MDTTERRRAVYDLLRLLYPGSPVLSAEVAASMERLIAERLGGYEAAHAYDERANAFAHWRDAIGTRGAVYRGDHAAMRGILTHLQQDREGDTWAMFDGGRGIRLEGGMRWEADGEGERA